MENLIKGHHLQDEYFSWGKICKEANVYGYKPGTGDGSRYEDGGGPVYGDGFAYGDGYGFDNGKGYGYGHGDGKG